jgi:hypothetical protein
MSHKLISHNSDLKQLRDEGLEVYVEGPYLLVKNIPYVNSQKLVVFGTLVSDLTLSGDKVVKPSTHVCYFTGDDPCNKDGTLIAGIKHSSQRKVLSDKVEIMRSFSNKPPGGYPNYYEKMSNYIKIISSPAMSLNSEVTPYSFKSVATSDSADSPLNYLDTNSSRAGIYQLLEKYKNHRIAIIGLGGTGSYILDLVCKNPVYEIHTFDKDDYFQHNAFRSPGAPSKETLEKGLPKVEYFKNIYTKMHSRIITHPYHITKENQDKLKGMTFVFVCIDNGPIKDQLFSYLLNNNINFIDVGMGLDLVDGQIIGTIRATLGTKEQHAHIAKYVSFSDDEDDVYSQNIQTPELNSLNAAMAVIKWKKTLGFYQDLVKDYHSTYTINANLFTSEDIDGNEV